MRSIDRSTFDAPVGWGAGEFSRTLRGSVRFAAVMLCVAVLPIMWAAEAGADVVYLTCSNLEIDEPIDGDDDNIVTKLYEVTLNDDLLEAEMKEIAVSPLNQADAIACNQEDRCYILDRLLLNNPDLENGGFIEEYVVGNPEPANVSQTVLTEDILGFPAPLQGLVLASFHPDGTLYAASQDDDRFYTIDLDLENDMANPTAEPVGITGSVLFDGAPLDIEGADLAVTADHRVYLWTNGAVRGLFELTLPEDNSEDITAVQLEKAVGQDPPNFGTGLAVRFGGTGDIVLSSTLDEITEHSVDLDGQLTAVFDMVSEPGFDHGSGDMANNFECMMKCAIEPSVVAPGETMEIQVELFHNAVETVSQEFAIEVIDTLDRVRFSDKSKLYEFRQGDRGNFSISMPIPERAPAGSYKIRMGVAGMQQGEANAECRFDVAIDPTRQID